jgi:hypothetical protein
VAHATVPDEHGPGLVERRASALQESVCSRALVRRARPRVDRAVVTLATRLASQAVVRDSRSERRAALDSAGSVSRAMPAFSQAEHGLGDSALAPPRHSPSFRLAPRSAGRSVLRARCGRIACEGVPASVAHRSAAVPLRGSSHEVRGFPPRAGG